MGVDQESYASGISLKLNLEFTLPGTRPFISLPSWVERTNSKYFCIEQAEAYSIPHPTESSIKVSFAKIVGRIGLGKGSHSNWRTLNHLGRLSFTMYGPMQAEIDSFDLALKKTLRMFNNDLFQCLAERRGKGALAGTLQEVAAEARRCSNKVRLYSTQARAAKVYSIQARAAKVN
jgi:hypothetical protein